MDAPPPLTDRLGRVVLDPESGRPIPDEQARQGAAQTLLRVMDRTAKLRGLDAPRRAQTSIAAVIAAASTADLREAVELMRQQNGGDGPEYDQVVRGEIEGGGAPAPA